MSFLCLLSKVNLNTLDVAGNRIRKIENISHLQHLEEFWVILEINLFKRGSLVFLFVIEKPEYFEDFYPIAM